MSTPFTLVSSFRLNSKLESSHEILCLLYFFFFFFLFFSVTLVSTRSVCVVNTNKQDPSLLVEINNFTLCSIS